MKPITESHIEQSAIETRKRRAGRRRFHLPDAEQVRLSAGYAVEGGGDGAEAGGVDGGGGWKSACFRRK